MKLADLHPTYVNKYVQRGERPTELSSDKPQKKHRPDRWNLEGGTVPSAGARFNLNLTLSLLRYACRNVTVSYRNGNTLVTGLFLCTETCAFAPICLTLTL